MSNRKFILIEVIEGNTSPGFGVIIIPALILIALAAFVLLFSFSLGLLPVIVYTVLKSGYVMPIVIGLEVAYGLLLLFSKSEEKALLIFMGLLYVGMFVLFAIAGVFNHGFWDSVFYSVFGIVTFALPVVIIASAFEIPVGMLYNWVSAYGDGLYLRLAVILTATGALFVIVLSVIDAISAAAFFAIVDYLVKAINATINPYEFLLPLDQNYVPALGMCGVVLAADFTFWGVSTKRRKVRAA